MGKEDIGYGMKNWIIKIGTAFIVNYVIFFVVVTNLLVIRRLFGE